jgi:hypothetical protein
LGESQPFFHSLFYQMKLATPIPNAARGEVQLTIAGEQYAVRFGLNVMRDWSKLSDKAPSEFGVQLEENHVETLAVFLSCAVRRYVPAAALSGGFGPDEAADLIESMSPDEADAVAEAILEAVSIDPLAAALRKQVAAKAAAQKAQQKNGGATSISGSAS